MPKKTRRRQTEESKLIAWCKWEFLRRNAEYRKDYEEFIKEFEPWFAEHGYWFDETTKPWGTENLHFFATVIAPRAKAICERWQTRDLFSPDWSFDKSGMHYYLLPARM